MEAEEHRVGKLIKNLVAKIDAAVQANGGVVTIDKLHPWRVITDEPVPDEATRVPSGGESDGSE